MSLIHADNFNIYGNDTSLMTNGRYAQAAGFAFTIGADPDGVSVPSVLRMGREGVVRRVIQSPTAKIGMGHRVWCGQLPGNPDASPPIFSFRDAANRDMAVVLITTTGSLVCYALNATTGGVYTVGQTAGPVLTANAWWHMECAFDATAKTLEVRVEGVPKLELDATDFANPLYSNVVSQVCIGNGVAGGGFSQLVCYKDYFIWDDQGTQNIDFLGACIVAELFPDDDVAIGGWVPSTGTEAWPILDTSTPGEAPYVSAAIPPVSPVIMTMTDLPEDITSVKGLVTIVRAKKVDGGDGQMQVSLISGGEFSDGVDRPITAAMTYWEDYHEIDPDTGSPWAPLAVDDVNFQINRTV